MEELVNAVEQEVIITNILELDITNLQITKSLVTIHVHCPSNTKI